MLKAWIAGSDPDQCELCGIRFDQRLPRRPSRSPCRDHCHHCGDIRGWLCGHCNHAEGFAKPGRTSLYVPKRFQRLVNDMEWRAKLNAYYWRHGCRVFPEERTRSRPLPEVRLIKPLDISSIVPL